MQNTTPSRAVVVGHRSTCWIAHNYAHDHTSSDSAMQVAVRRCATMTSSEGE